MILSRGFKKARHRHGNPLREITGREALCSGNVIGKGGGRGISKEAGLRPFGWGGGWGWGDRSG